MSTRGKLVIVGGAVDKGTLTDETAYNKPTNLNFFELGILKRIIHESKDKDSKVVVVTAASQIPEEIGKEYISAFKKLDVANVKILDMRKREEANERSVVEQINGADIVFFTGGDQLRLTSLLGGTVFLDTLKNRFENDGLMIAGTSAGAAVCSESMIYQGSSSEALLKGAVKITQGFGFIKDVIIDTHFVKRGRIGRLFQAVASNPGQLGIGLGEDTGLLNKNNGYLEAIGSGLVIIVDGKQIKDTNIFSIPVGSPISIKNLIVHALSLHDVFNIRTRELTIHHKVGVEEAEW